MALRKAIRQTLVIGATTRSLNSNSFRLKNKQVISSYIFNHENNNGSNQESSSHEVNWKLVCLFTAAVGLTPIALNCSLHKNDLLAEEEDEENNDQEIIEKGNSFRKFSRIGRVFDYFATYQVVNHKGNNEMLMGVKDFCNAVTPGNSSIHGIYRGVHTVIETDDASSPKMYENEKLPTEHEGERSLLKEIQVQGLLTFEDFCFLLHILSTPRKYMDIDFQCFDVSADGNVEAKEFAHVIATMTNYKGDPTDLVNEKRSGLINYLFGKDRKKKISKEEFLKFQKDLMNDVFWIEFNRYSKDGKTISGADFCDHLLLRSNIASKQKRQMLHRVKTDVKTYKGVTFEAFKGFYNVLFGGSDLERAMVFTHAEKRGITSTEFMNMARRVADCDVDPHIVDIIYTLLDDDRDGYVGIKEFSLLFQHFSTFQQDFNINHFKLELSN